MLTMWSKVFGSLILIFSCLSSANAVSCSTCMHIRIDLQNLPDEVTNQINTMMSSMSNPDCVKGTAQMTECPAAGLGMTSKCMTATVNARLVGMKNLYPEAVMDQEVIVRSCAQRAITEENKCINLDDLDSQTKAQVTSSLDQARAQWDSITLNGKTCFSDSSKPYIHTHNEGNSMFNPQHSLVLLIFTVIANLALAN